MVDIVRINEKSVTIRHHDGKTSREKRILCVGGPLDGERLSWTQCHQHKDFQRYDRYKRPQEGGYCDFNRAWGGPETSIRAWIGPTNKLAQKT